MHRKVKVLIAGWLASRIETRSRRLRRALRDHQRAEWRLIHAAESSCPRPAALRRMVLQRGGSDQLRNGRAIASVIPTTRGMTKQLVLK